MTKTARPGVRLFERLKFLGFMGPKEGLPEMFRTLHHNDIGGFKRGPQSSLHDAITSDVTDIEIWTKRQRHLL